MRRPLFGWLVACGVAVGCFASAASAQGFRAVYSKDGTDVWAVGDAGAEGRAGNAAAWAMTGMAGPTDPHAGAASGAAIG